MREADARIRPPRKCRVRERRYDATITHRLIVDTLPLEVTRSVTTAARAVCTLSPTSLRGLAWRRMEDLEHRLARRLKQVPAWHLLAELKRRQYNMVRDESLGTGNRPVTGESEELSVRLDHFPDVVLLAAAREHGFVSEQRATLTKGFRRNEHGSLEDALEDTFTGEEMKTAYEEMLELRRERRRRDPE